MNSRTARLTLALAALHMTAWSATIYSNTATDLGESLFYAAGPYVQIGDQIQLAGTERDTTRAQVQLYNLGTAGSFDAILRFYAAASPVGAQLGPDFELTNQAAAELSLIDLVFDTTGATVPNDLIFTLEVRNPTAGVDLGLNVYGPTPATGASDNAFLIVRNSSFGATSGVSGSNLYFQLDADGSASAVPEPVTWWMAGAGLVLLGLRKRWNPLS